MRKPGILILLGMVFAAMLAGTGTAEAGAEINKSFFAGLAIEGYDPVAYFTRGKPVEGKSAHEVEWKGATWRFADAPNRDLFTEAPEKYAPQYGGYCAWAVSQGYTAKIDPAAWRVVDGKLYLNYSKGVQRQWESDVAGNIAKADANWPEIEAAL